MAVGGAGVAVTPIMTVTGAGLAGLELPQEVIKDAAAAMRIENKPKVKIPTERNFIVITTIRNRAVKGVGKCLTLRIMNEKKRGLPENKR